MAIRELGNPLGNPLSLPKDNKDGFSHVINSYSVGINFPVSTTNYINLPFRPINNEAIEVSFVGFQGSSPVIDRKFIPFLDSPTSASGYLWIIPNAADRGRDQHISYDPYNNRLACVTGTSASMRGNIIITEYARKVKNKAKLPSTAANTIYDLPFKIENPEKVFIGSSSGGDFTTGFLMGYSNGLIAESLSALGYDSATRGLRILSDSTFDSSTFTNDTSSFYLIEFE